MTAADGSGGLARAEVRLTGPGAGSENPSIAADEQGGYEFRELPAGSYTIAVEKRGFLTGHYGQRPGHPSSRSIEMVDGQSREDVDVALSKGAVIAVRVTDEFGNPRAGVNLQALEYRGVAGRRRLMPRHSAFSLADVVWPWVSETDDRGEVRLVGLPPGEYYPLATVAGFRGNLMDPPEERSNRQLIYPPTYYPGTPSIGDAQPVTLKAGEEVSVAIALVPARASHLSGRVVSADGTPATGAVVLLPVMEDGSAPARFLEDLVDGAFTFWDLRPGRYFVETATADPPPPGEEYGFAAVTVASENIADLIVTTASSGTLRGHVIFDTGVPPTGIEGEDFSIAARADDPLFFADSRLNNDWSFTIEGIRRPARIAPSGWWDGWEIKEVTLGGVDVTGALLAAGDVEVVLTQANAMISGVVLDDRGAAVVNCPVVIFPDDSDLWRRAGAIFVSTTDALGRFRILTVPPGKYLAVAAESAEGGEVPDPEALDGWRGRATRVTIAPDESKTLSLPLNPF